MLFHKQPVKLSEDGCNMLMLSIFSNDNKCATYHFSASSKNNSSTSNNFPGTAENTNMLGHILPIIIGTSLQLCESKYESNFTMSFYLLHQKGKNTCNHDSGMITFINILVAMFQYVYECCQSSRYSK